ncbi:MAG: response regulator transcription factor [Bryobacteraceae bacterium]
MMRIGIVEPYVIVCDGLEAIVERSNSAEICFRARTASEALEKCRENPPDLVCTEMRLGECDGPELISRLRREFPQVHVLVLSMHDDEHSVVNAIRAGARGFVSKTSPYSEWLDAIRTVGAGGAFWSSSVSSGLMRYVKGGRRGSVGDTASPLDRLSPREQQVLRMVAEGKTSKQIAEVLQLSPDSVRTYRKTIAKKLNTSGSAALTRLAISSGLASRA